MKRHAMKLLLAGLLVASGCAYRPTGPTVMVLPTPGKPFDQFVSEDNECRQWAALRTGEEPGEAANRSTVSGSVVGTAVGAGAGAALGAIGGNAGAGAAIGGGTGLLFGTASGAGAGESRAAEVQRRYDITYTQCMYAKGNQIPGVVTRRERRAAPPPPAATAPQK